MQVDLGQRKTVTAIATQGNAYVEKYSRLNEYYIQYSDDGSNWKEYVYEGQRKARLFYDRGGAGDFLIFSSRYSSV